MAASVRDVPLLLLDIDGTVRKGFDELGRFVNTVADVELFPEVLPLLRTYKAAGWRILGVSNQGGIALGHVQAADVIAAFMRTMQLCEFLIDKIAFCQHHPDAIDPLLRRCWCRKPKVGLALDAIFTMETRYPGERYRPGLALFVGDRDEDRACAAGLDIDFLLAREWRAGAHVL